MQFRTVVKCSVEEGIALVTVDNPPVNALNIDVILGLSECFAQLAEHPSLRVVILTGEGRAFIAGADLREILDGGDSFLRESSLRGHAVFRAIEDFPLPTIAMLNGAALGGGLELAACCDIVLASEKARLGLPETALGIVPGWGGLSRLPKRINSGQVKKMAFTAEHISASYAREIGLVHEVLAAESLRDRAFEIARKICGNGPIAVREAKKAINTAKEMPLSDAIDCEIQAVALCGGTRDKAEGIDAFLNKRPAVFTNS